MSHVRVWIAGIAACLAAASTFAQAPGTPVKLSGLSGTAPAAWKSEKPANRLRSYQFKLPSDDKDFEDAEIAVFPDSSPKWEEKFKEWKETVIPPDGVAPEKAQQVSRFEVGGFTVHQLNAYGTWKYRERPRDPSSKEMLKPEYRIVWLVVLGKEETTHIRFSGPNKVVLKHEDDFQKWIKGLK